MRSVWQLEAIFHTLDALGNNSATVHLPQIIGQENQSFDYLGAVVAEPNTTAIKTDEHAHCEKIVASSNTGFASKFANQKISQTIA